MISMRKSTAIVALALIAALLVGGAALAASVGRNGKAVTAVRTATASNSVYATPTSNTWVDVPDMKVFVTVPRDQRAILIITFSMASSCGLVTSDWAAYCTMRVTLDGNPVDPGVVDWDWTPAGQGSSSTVRSMQWVAGPVAAGEHQVKVQINVSSASVLYTGRTLTVLRSKF